MAPIPRILIVDDEPFLRALLASFMKKSGFEVLEAGDAATALAQLVTFDPSIAILDVMMPGMTGLEMIDKVKQWKPACEVIMITGGGSDQTRKECMAKGAYRVMEKPLEMVDLRNTIEGVLQKISEAS
jgi:DNA-binding response OmpR family regulator